MKTKIVFGVVTVFTICLAIALFSGTSFAIGGQCVNCHTMHNSQNGAAVTASGTANEQLLTAGCVACHTATGAARQLSPFGSPAVDHANDPTGQGGTFTNAGGSFYWVKQAAGDAKGHNVADITGLAVDAAIGTTPPGWDPNASAPADPFGQVAGGAATWGANQLTCGGTYGCHGTHTVAGSFPSVSGAHHNNPSISATQASTSNTVGNSYRFLGGIKGLEQIQWNFNESAASHNEYYGKHDNLDRSAANTLYRNKDTINYLCAKCHGMFHSKIDGNAVSGSPWIRHPTDIVLPNATEYAAYTTYNLEAPVARPVIPAASTATVTPGDSTTANGAIVSCVSCHRAHGTPQPDLLRWDYTTMVAGTTGAGQGRGCFVCHTQKDG